MTSWRKPYLRRITRKHTKRCLEAVNTPGTYLNFPFDAELFIHQWNEEPDPVKTAFLNSGVLAPDPLIAGQLASDGNLFTVPFYNILDGDEVNEHNGQTDITGVPEHGGEPDGRGVWGARKGSLHVILLLSYPGQIRSGILCPALRRLE